jgi:phosphonate transport system substrate-binding protein
MLIDAQAAGEIDYAIYSATAFATAVVKCACVEAFAAPVRPPMPRLHSVLVARVGDQIEDLVAATASDLASTDDPVSASIVRARLSSQGIDAQAFFLSVSEHASPEDANVAPRRGRSCGGVVALPGARRPLRFGTFTRMVADDALAMERIRIVWQSPLIPSGPTPSASTCRRNSRTSFRGARRWRARIRSA